MRKARSFVLGCLLVQAVLFPAALRAEEPLATNEPMRRWAAAHLARGVAPARQVEDLREALVARGWRQRDDLTLTAAEAWSRREGDCVSFALLLVALTRSAGLETGFWLAGPPVSPRPAPPAPDRELDVARGHLAAAYAGDVAGSPERLYDAAGSTGPAGFHPISDSEAIAVYHSNRGAQRLLAGDWRGAERALEAATAIAGDLAEAWSNLGVARSRLGDPNGAEVAYRRAISLAPESTAGWRNLAILLERRLGACPAPPAAPDRF